MSDTLAFNSKSNTGMAFKKQKQEMLCTWYTACRHSALETLITQNASSQNDFLSALNITVDDI